MFRGRANFGKALSWGNGGNALMKRKRSVGTKRREGARGSIIGMAKGRTSTAKM